MHLHHKRYCAYVKFDSRNCDESAFRGLPWDPESGRSLYDLARADRATWAMRLAAVWGPA